jgi:hypothetical protein
MGEAGLTASLKEIRNMIRKLSNDIQEIKKILGIVSEKKGASMYPWHLPNTTTTADYGEED